MSYQPSAQTVNTQEPFDASRLGWLGLACFDGFGTRTLHKFAARFRGDGEAAWKAPLTCLEGFGTGQAVRDRFNDYRRKTELPELARRLAENGIRFMLETDADYPFLLKQIPDPPFALFCRGQPKAAPTIAIVGTRNCTAYGQRVAIELARDLALAGFTIVSGLALGIDAVAHAAALDQEAVCWAVLAGGCDEPAIYPRHNLNLAKRILEHGGCLISEFPPGTYSLKHHFALRNRIISGLSRAVVVVEAAEDSGSLITAHLALDQNRDVFAVPGPITSRLSGGTNKLLKQGAIPCTGTEDILAQLDTQAPVRPPPDTASLPETERHVLQSLDEPLLPDELARRLKLPAAEIARLLVALELKDLVTQQEGRKYALTQQIRKRAG
jgi:DNA processing protein